MTKRRGSRDDERPSDEYNAFESFARRLVRVPKREVDRVKEQEAPLAAEREKDR